MQVFEVSWEVCNKVGGINTVVRSKAQHMVEFYQENYFLVGPYFINKAIGEFEEEVPNNGLKKIFEDLKKEGISCRFGKWLIHGSPKTILVDFTEFTKNANNVKKFFWESHKVDSLNTQYFDFDEPVIWSYAVGRLLEEIARTNKIVAHCHEWLSAGTILYLKAKNVKASTVFTTHATILGRTIASADLDLYGMLDTLEADKKAYEFGINAKFQMEKGAATSSDVFTTVSEITKIEAEKILGRKVDFVLPNGLNLDRFPSIEEATIKHRMYKAKILNFLTYYFSPYYTIDLHNTLILFLCGRYEFKDKGIDVFITALGQLNEMMKKSSSNKTVVAFFWVPGNIRGIKPQILENKTRYLDIKDLIDDNIAEIRTEIIHSAIAQTEMSGENILSEETLKELKVKVRKFAGKQGTPPLSTHDLFDEENDSIIKAFKENNLNNKEQDKVKVIFYSIYLTGADGLLDISYYESMSGSHLGIFPSYYEPWGYTPLEAASLMVPSVTTDLAGFGRFVNSVNQESGKGIYVLKRLGKTHKEVANELAEQLFKFCSFSNEERIAEKIFAKKIAGKADWKIFAKNYKQAHDAAFKKVFDEA